MTHCWECHFWRFGWDHLKENEGECRVAYPETDHRPVKHAQAEACDRIERCLGWNIRRRKYEISN
ncbi:MAG: hypothetical protein HOC20_13850 [Chloroflexi bacterium]|jgi:hypothetical protein|nr:hypothetical protein [Chloroflexota bacterium]